MKSLLFSKRTAKEIIRDPLTLFFGIGFPVIVLILLSAIQANIPVDMFEIRHLTPGITVFGLSFVSLFGGLLVAGDRSGAFLLRLYTTPMRAIDYIIGYTCPLIPFSLVQAVVCYLVAFCFGLTPTIGILWALLFLIPVSLLFISIGLLCGSVLNAGQIGGICGALLTNLTAWLSGVWFDISLLGGGFETMAKVLPFVHAVELERAILLCDFSGIFPHLLIVLAWTVALFAAAVFFFLRQMKKR